MKFHKFQLLILFFIFSSIIVIADDQYKPYLHKAVVPEHPKLDAYGFYQTNLFPGGAAYTYGINVPKGTNGLTPSISISYNSQSAKERPSILGAGWSLSKSMVYRDTNGTFNDTADDEFKLILDGSQHDLVYANGAYHTKLESYFKIQKLSTSTNTYGEYWLVTSKDGSNYRFGYNPDSELASNLGYPFIVKWSLDLVNDTHGNNIYYSYSENPNNEDFGSVYLSGIRYNNDLKRKITFDYEPNERPDKRISYENGNKLYESRRLKEISVFADNGLARRYSFDYSNLTLSLSSLSKITYYGSDNSSILNNATFEYYMDKNGFNDVGSYISKELFTDYSSHLDFGVRLADINNDGFVDIIKSRDGYAKSTLINNRANGWANDTSYTFPVYISTSSGTDNGARLADVNSDGKVDILLSKDSTREVYLRNGSTWLIASDWILPSVDFVSGTTDNGIQLDDINGDGKIDLIQGKDTTQKTWLNNGHGWSEANWSLPASFVDSSGNDNGLRLIDLNADGLPDLIQGIDKGTPTKKAWLNNGAGWALYGNFSPPDYFITSAKADNGIRFSDLNGDGLVDILQDFYQNASSTYRSAWLNTGNNWSLNSSWEANVYFTESGYNIGRRMGDVNGDGFADIILAYGNSSGQDAHTYIKNSSNAYLLHRIINSYGGIIEIDYNSSTSFNNSEELGFNLWVVNDYYKNNSLIGEFSNTGKFNYKYFGGKYDYREKEFRGFNIVNETRPDNSTITHYFHQDEALKGKEYRSEIYGSDNKLYSKSESNYNYTHNGYYEIFLKDSASYLYDGDLVPKVTNVSFTYDNYGNVISKLNHGEANASGDEKYEYYSYAYSLNGWIIDKLWRYELYDSDNSTLAKKTEYGYDNKGFGAISSKGELTSTREWNDNGEDIIKRFEYDSYGNMVKSIDALGFETIYRYGLRDTTFTYSDKVTNALGHYIDYEYDLATGNLLWEEKEGIRKTYTYDAFGRLLKQIDVYDSVQLPTKEYHYYLDGIAPEIIKVSARESANNYSEVLFYYDGFGNLVQLKSIIENNETITKNIFYDASDRVKYEENPYFENYTFNVSIPTTANKTYYIYDAMDRVIKVINPDGTNKTTVFDKWTISDYDENGHQHDYILDAYGRIANVLEYNIQPLLNNKAETYNTSYAYDTQDNLIKIIDNEENEFKFTYDSLGRKIKLDDPDLGVWAYSYDANGNLRTQTDARGHTISLYYDSLNRILQKNSTNVNMTFVYDGQYWGTLTNITQGAFKIRYTYDKKMRAISEEHNFGTSSWIALTSNYDSANRIIEKIALSKEIELTYNKQGKVNRIYGYITRSSYNAFGSLVNKTYNNGLVSAYTYNSTNNRLTRIATGSIQNLQYQYDTVGNILSIADSVNGRNLSMSYDAIDRLATTAINNDLYQYEYDAIGNIKRIVNGNSTKRLNYNGIIPHAPSQVIDYSNVSAGIYDARDLDTGTRNRTFEFFLLKEKLSNLSNVIFSINFGLNNYTSIPLNISSPVMVLIENNYSNGGAYNVNISTSTDANIFADKFGVDAKSVALIASNHSIAYIEFMIEKDIHEKSLNAFWNCSDIANSSVLFNITDNTMVIVEYNYTNPGNKNIACSVSSSDGSGNKSADIEIKGLKIENYDLIDVDTNKKIASYEVRNHFNSLLVNISTISDGSSPDILANISSGSFVLAIVELNYSTDGNKQIGINAISDDINASYSDNFNIKAIDIANFDRYDSNGTAKVFVYDIYNDWPINLSIRWNLTDPNVNYSTYLNQSQFVMVIIEANYTQGLKQPELKAYSNGFTSTFKDRFTSFIIHLLDMQLLKETRTSTVTEIIAKSHKGNNSASWQYNTGQKVLNSTVPFYLNESKDVIIIIESNYTTSGRVYPVNASVNSTSNLDSWRGAVHT